MGSSKQLLAVAGVPMVRRAAIGAIASCTQNVIVVCPATNEAVRSSLAGLPVEICLNADPERGIGTSIAAGIRRAARRPVGAAIVALGDQPLVGAPQLDALALAWRTHDVDIVASRYGGSVGVPALFDRAMFESLAGLPEDRGCKGLILGHPPDRVLAIDCAQAELDVDTPEDYARLLEAEA